jgi:hypothetical protein
MITTTLDLQTGYSFDIPGTDANFRRKNGIFFSKANAMIKY